MDKEIKINEIKETPVELFSPDDKLIGIIDNVLSFDDVRVQIKKLNASGYYVVFNKEKIYITNKGKVPNWPFGMFDTFEKNLDLLLGI